MNKIAQLRIIIIVFFLTYSGSTGIDNGEW